MQIEDSSGGGGGSRMSPRSRKDEDDSERPVETQNRRVWTRVLGWTAVGVCALVLLAVIVVGVALKSERFHAYMIRTLESKAGESLGANVKVENYVVNLHTLSVDLYGITVSGAPPYANVPLLQLEHARASVAVVSVLHRRWHFEEIRLEHPVVQVVVDAQGRSNLPVFKNSQSSSDNNTIFDFGIRHAALDHGEIYYNSRPSELTADLHELDLNASFNPLLKMYTGKLKYANGHIQYGNLRPVAHDFDAEFRATQDEFELVSAKLASGATQIHLNANVKNYTAPAAEGRYDIVADGAQLRQILRQENVPSGMVHLTGTISYLQGRSRGALESLKIEGDLSSRRIDVSAKTVKIAAGDIRAHYTLADGTATLRDFHAGVLGGAVDASGAVELTGGNRHSKMEAKLRGISLADLRQAVAGSALLPDVALTGALNATAKANWGKTLDDLVAHADADLQGQMTKTQTAKAVAAASAGVHDSAPVPIQGEIHSNYTAKSEEISFKDSFVHSGQADIHLNGTASRNSNLSVQLRAGDLREVEAMASLFRTPAAGSNATPLGLSGTAAFDGTVRGSIAAPHLAGHLTAHNLQVEGTSWKLVRADVEVDPSRAALRNAELDPESRGRITLDGSAALNHWAFDNDSSFQINMDASQVNLADLEKISGQQMPVTGTLGAKIVLHGTEAALAGNGNLTITGASAYGQPIESAKLTFNGTGDTMHGELAVLTSAGNIDARAEVQPKAKTYTAELTSTGIHLDKVELVQQK